jgi:hypothetical protein
MEAHKMRQDDYPDCGTGERPDGTLPATMGGTGADDLRHILDGTTIAVLKQIEGLGYPHAVTGRPRQAF